MKNDNGTFCDFCGMPMKQSYTAVDIDRGIEVPSGNPKGLMIVLCAYGDVPRIDVCQRCYENAVCQASAKIHAQYN